VCRKGAWAELTVQVTFRSAVQSRMHGLKINNMAQGFGDKSFALLLFQRGHSLVGTCEKGIIEV